MGWKSSGAPRGLPTGAPSGGAAGDTYHVLRGLELPDGTTFAVGDVVTAEDLDGYLEHFLGRDAVATPQELERRAAGEAMLAAVDEELGSPGKTWPQDDEEPGHRDFNWPRDGGPDDDDLTEAELAELLADDDALSDALAVDAPEGTYA